MSPIPRHMQRRRLSSTARKLSLVRADTKVTVSLLQDSSRPITYQRFIRVQVYAQRPGMVGQLKRQFDLFPHQHGSEREFERSIEIIAAGMATDMCLLYGENHDPSEVAKKAREAYRELRMDFEPKTAPHQERGEGPQL